MGLSPSPASHKSSRNRAHTSACKPSFRSETRQNYPPAKISPPPDLCPALREPFHPAPHSTASRPTSPLSATKSPYPSQSVARRPAAPPTAPTKRIPPSPQVHSACSFLLLNLDLTTQPVTLRRRLPRWMTLWPASIDVKRLQPSIL